MKNTTGIEGETALAIRVADTPTVAMTATLRATRSAAKAGSRSVWPSAKRYSTVTEVGIADALVCRKLPDGKLEIIDGHLRQDTNPDLTWPVLVLDITEEEANKLLISMDPLAGMATMDLPKFDLLRDAIRTDSANLTQMWEASRADAERLLQAGIVPDFQPGSIEDQGRLDQKKQVTCPACNHVFTP